MSLSMTVVTDLGLLFVGKLSMLVVGACLASVTNNPMHFCHLCVI